VLSSVSPVAVQPNRGRARCKRHYSWQRSTPRRHRTAALHDAGATIGAPSVHQNIVIPSFPARVQRLGAADRWFRTRCVEGVSENPRVLAAGTPFFLLRKRSARSALGSRGMVPARKKCSMRRIVDQTSSPQMLPPNRWWGELRLLDIQNRYPCAAMERSPADRWTSLRPQAGLRGLPPICSCEHSNLVFSHGI